MNRLATAALLGAVTLAVLGAAADLNEAGKAAYGRGDYVEAERLFRAAAAQAPRVALYHYHLAVALTRLGHFVEAMEAHRTALTLGPSPALAENIREALRILEPAGRERPPSAAGPTRVRLERVSGGWVAIVILNDTRRARFLVDTGASISVISPALAGELDIRVSRDARVVTLETLGGRTRGPLVRLASVKVGDVEAGGVAAVIHETGPAFDGILGNSFLARYSVTLHPDRDLLVLGSR